MAEKSVPQRIRKLYLQERLMSEVAPLGCQPLILVLDNLKPSFNVGKIFRSANAFGVQQVFMIGIPFFDPRPSTGGFRHTKSSRFETFSQCHDWLIQEGYEIFALDVQGTVYLSQCALPSKSALVLGHEEYGLSFKPQDFPKVKLCKIPQFGKVQSLNVAVAASIGCYEYVRQNKLSK
jgi:tRNA G18 (ribose-2'-O)-methylase SpoU